MSYLKIAEYYTNCFKKHGDNHLGVDWPNPDDAVKRYQVMMDLTKFHASKNPLPTLLDFGCGAGHMLEYLQNTNQDLKIEYSGLDISPEFYNTCTAKFPEVTFYNKDIMNDEAIPTFDYIVVNGVFTEKLDLSQEEMMNFFQTTLVKLWDKCNVGLAFNLMSKHVDCERDDLFHVSLDELGWFLKEKLSRDFIIRNDYKLYEYTTYVYKK